MFMYSESIDSRVTVIYDGSIKAVRMYVAAICN